MPEDRIVSCLGSFVDILNDPKGYDPESLQGLSLQAPDLVSSFIRATLSSDETAMQSKFSELAIHASRTNSFSGWFNLARLAHRLFFHQAAIEYYEQAMRLAEVQFDKIKIAQALSGLGSLYSEVEDWDRAGACYEKAEQCLQECGQTTPTLPVLRDLGHVHKMRGELGKAMQCYNRVLEQIDPEDRSGRAEALDHLGELHQLQGDLAGAEECYQKMPGRARAMRRQGWRRGNPGISGIALPAAGHRQSGTKLH